MWFLRRWCRLVRVLLSSLVVSHNVVFTLLVSSSSVISPVADAVQFGVYSDTAFHHWSPFFLDTFVWAFVRVFVHYYWICSSLVQQWSRYQKSAEIKNANGKNSVGYCYRHGIGAEKKDEHKASIQ
ncbi:hypothetical protein C2G38_2185056 [Gigaspora rosea]|uniref:Uncharacterized protein n=1 Tax=Gigaspora rosea TaxID=44941 RepID=A0A397VG08_9GLOM|nr:hypothetical protein C2G38_2185056 [Gigaspora rosea]